MEHISNYWLNISKGLIELTRAISSKACSPPFVGNVELNVSKVFALLMNCSDANKLLCALDPKIICRGYRVNGKNPLVIDSVFDSPYLL